MMTYGCRTWDYASAIHIRRRQVIQKKSPCVFVDAFWLVRYTTI